MHEIYEISLHASKTSYINTIHTNTVNTITIHTNTVNSTGNLTLLAISRTYEMHSVVAYTCVHIVY